MRMPLFSKPKHWLTVVVGIILASLLFSACGSPASILDTAGPVADEEKVLFYIILFIATLVFVGVEAALIYSIVRFRERPGMPNPRQNHGNLRIEALWTIIPAVILFITLGFTIQTLFAVASEPASSDTVNVEVTGHQWWWEFYYPQYKITTADTLHAPVGKIVHVDLFSNNVIHSFWIPALTGKTDDIPGHDNQKWFKADKTGTYVGECAEFCGIQHGHMEFDVSIDTVNDFNTWVTTQQQAAVTPPGGSLAAQGQKVFNQCTGCHGIVGVDVKGYYDPKVACANVEAQSTDAEQCKVGPNLTHFGSRPLIAGGVLTNNADQCNSTSYDELIKNCHLAQWLNDPQGIKPGNDMQIGALSHDQIVQLVAYLESLK